jgi:hypothetical protein
MQLLGRYELSPWLIVGAIAVSAGSLVAWLQSHPCSNVTVAHDSSCNLLVPVVSKDDASHLYRAMQRRDSLPDQTEPRCGIELFGLDETKVSVATMQTFACDVDGCQAIAAPKNDTRILHCSDGLPEQFLLNSDFVKATTWHARDEASQQGQWHQVWCDDLGTVDGASDSRRLFSCMASTATPGAEAPTVAPFGMVKRTNRPVEPTPQPLHRTSRM